MLYETAPARPRRTTPANSKTVIPARVSWVRIPPSPVDVTARDLATLIKNTVRVPNSSATFDKLANPTPLQERALRLLSLRATL